MPHIWFMFITCFVLVCIITSKPEAFAKTAIYAIWEPLMLWMSGLGTTIINGSSWYISAMILSMLVLYPIMIKYFDLFVRVIAPAVAIFVYGWLSQKYGFLNHYSSWVGFTYSGMLRAIAALSLGCVCWGVAQWLKGFRFKKTGKCLLSVIEISCYFLVVVGANVGGEKLLSFLMVLLLAVAIPITFSKQSLTGTVFDKKICYWLGNFSLVLYLNHITVRKVFQKLALDLPYFQIIAFFLAASFLWALFALYFVKWVQRLWAKCSPKVKAAIFVTGQTDNPEDRSI